MFFSNYFFFCIWGLPHIIKLQKKKASLSYLNLKQWHWCKLKTIQVHLQLHHRQQREHKSETKFVKIQILKKNFKKNSSNRKYIYLDNFPMTSVDCRFDWRQSEEVWLVRIVYNGNKEFGNFHMTISGSKLSRGISIRSGRIGINSGRSK